ncbi:hypothetical protein B0H11DRAFT_2242127 [Mycena galericulata]|nr:hypothetical protein B0H11DRAFT_2242127 [Mycena galericulata]
MHGKADGNQASTKPPPKPAQCKNSDKYERACGHDTFTAAVTAQALSCDPDSRHTRHPCALARAA